MPVRIFIEDLEMDVDKVFTHQVTYAIDDLRQVDTKMSHFTKTIILPGTTRNNKLLGNIFEFNNSNFTNDQQPNVLYNFNAAKVAKCRVDVDGMLSIKGVFRLLEIIIDGNQVEYECSIVGELGGFAMKLGANKLEDLDFSEYNEIYSIANIVASWNNDNGGAGLYYPLIDIGQVSNGAPYGVLKKDYQYRAFRPALFVKEFIDKTFEQAGYTYECDLFNTDRFKRWIIPYNKKDHIMRGDRVAYATAIANSYLIHNETTSPNPITISWENFSGTNWSLVAGSNIQYDGVPAQLINAVIHVDGVYNYDYISPLQSEGIRAVLLHWTSISLSGTLISYQDIPGGSQDIPFSIDFALSNFTIQQGDFFQIGFVSITDDSNITINSGTFTVRTTVPGWVNVNIGDTMLVNDMIPQNILQKDFFVSIMKMFNLYVDQDKFKETHLVIKPFVDYYNLDRSSYEDWSDKVDRLRPIHIKPMSELNSRYYDFKFKKDTDYWNDLYNKRYNEGYGDRRFDSTFEFAKEIETIDVIFAATPLVGYVGEDKVVSTIFKQNNNVEERVDCVIRILQARKISGVASWDIMSGVTIAHSDTVYPYAGHLNDPDVPSNDLNFGVPKELFFGLVSGDISVNQFNVYYSSYMAEITDKDSRLLMCELKLTDLDIFNLDFSRFKFIDGGLWRLAKIDDYTAGANATTKTELLRVIYTIY